LIEGQPLRSESMTGLPAGQLTDLIDRVREIVGDEWEKPPVGRPHVLPLPTAVIAVLFGLRHNLPDEVLGEVFGCSQATITRYLPDTLEPFLALTDPQTVVQGRPAAVEVATQLAAIETGLAELTRRPRRAHPETRLLLQGEFLRSKFGQATEAAGSLPS
jgi:hypothetical protein